MTCFYSFMLFKILFVLRFASNNSTNYCFAVHAPLNALIISVEEPALLSKLCTCTGMSLTDIGSRFKNNLVFLFQADRVVQYQCEYESHSSDKKKVKLKVDSVFKEKVKFLDFLC